MGTKSGVQIGFSHAELVRCRTGGGADLFPPAVPAREPRRLSLVQDARVVALILARAGCGIRAVGC